MDIQLQSLGSHLTKLAWVALRSFVGTLLVVTLAGIVLAGVSYYFLREYHWIYGTIAVVVALAESIATGFILGAKRAMAMALAYGLGALGLGRSLVRLVFERMLGIAQGKELSERGERIARGLESLPLAKADELLSGAVRSLSGDSAQTGWLRRTIQRRLLESVRKYTLARFRDEEAGHGGINVLKVKEELEQTVDDVLVRKVRGGLRLWTVLVIVGLPLVIAVQTAVVIMILTMHH